MNSYPSSGEYHHYNTNISATRATPIIVRKNSLNTNGVALSLSHDSFEKNNENDEKQPSQFALLAWSTSSSLTDASSDDKTLTRKKRVPWSRLEDLVVLSMVEESGTSKPNWSKIAAEVNLVSPAAASRNGKQCRERWLNHLRSNIKKGAWTKEEEAMILYYYQMFGPKWSAMAQVMKNRTDNDIKNKWNSMRRSAKFKEAKFSDRSIKGSAQNSQAVRTSGGNILPKQQHQFEAASWERKEQESICSSRSQEQHLLFADDSLANSSASPQYSFFPSSTPTLHHHDGITATVTDRDYANHSMVVRGLDYWENNLDF